MTGIQGTGKYEGFVWNGRAWVDPSSGERGRFNPWERTHWAWRAFFVLLAGGLCVYFGIVIGIFTGSFD